MKTFEEIKNSGKVIITEKDDEGFSGMYYGFNLSATLVCSWGAGWEHVSISPTRKNYTPSWDDMYRLKEVFFKDDEAVIQIHPPKSEYINNMPNCLHLWRCTYKDMVLPPAILVGVKKGQTSAEVEQAVKAAYAEAEPAINKLDVMFSELDRSMECVLESDHRSFSNRETENGWIFDHIIAWRKMISPYIKE